MQQSWTRFLPYILLAAILYMPIFGHLDALPVRLWDESRLAINAYEMWKHGDVMVTHYGGEPDMWNTKPPLMIWLQVALMQLLGVNELALRLPSAFAALFTCVALVTLSVRYLNNFWSGFIAVLVLITSPGYLGLHVARTGDYDALLTLFTTTAAMGFFAYCETLRRKWLYLFFILITGAVLTKGVAGLLFSPAMILYALYRRRVVLILKNKDFYFGLSILIVFAGGYYLLRELQNPGYLKAVYMNELGGRYLNTIEEHQHGFWYYFDNLRLRQFSEWYLLAPCGALLGWLSKNERVSRLSLFSCLICATFFLIISSAKTKLEWYPAPVYPFLALLAAAGIHVVFEWLEQSPYAVQALRFNALPYISLFLIFIIPYKNTIGRTYMPEEAPYDKDLYEISYYLKKALRGEYSLDGQFLMEEGYNANNIFYLKALYEKGMNVGIRYRYGLQPGDIVFFYQNPVKEHIEAHYRFEQIQSNGNIITYKIHGPKE